MAARLNTFALLDPGHFHSALVFKEPLEGVSRKIHVYGPLDSQVISYQNFIYRFNRREQNPTEWELEVHAGPESLKRLIQEKPAEAVVLAGHNREKIHKILECLKNGLHVLVDKPWIIDSRDLPLLEQAIEIAREKNLVILDIMTERHEVVSRLQREIVADRDLFGDFVTGPKPAFSMRSSHSLCKKVNGNPLLRPISFFDIGEQGEGLADVGVHLVDLAIWTLFPGQSIDHRNDIRVTKATRWPTVLDLSQFQAATGLERYPDFFEDWIEGDCLTYFGNNTVDFEVRGLGVHVDTRWDFMAGPDGLDTYSAVCRGTKARLEIRQNESTNYKSEMFIRSAGESGPLFESQLVQKVNSLQSLFPGLQFQKIKEDYQLLIPKELKSGHESHFARIINQFLGYLRGEINVPAEEYPCLLSKYFITVEGVRLARASQHSR